MHVGNEICIERNLFEKNCILNKNHNNYERVGSARKGKKTWKVIMVGSNARKGTKSRTKRENKTTNNFTVHPPFQGHF